MKNTNLILKRRWPDSLPEILASVPSYERFVVCVLDPKIDILLVIDRLKNLARLEPAAVLLIGISSDTVEVPFMQERLASLKLALEKHAMAAETRIFAGSNALISVDKIIRNSDLVIQFEEDATKPETRQIFHQLKNHIPVPVAIIPVENSAWDKRSKFWSQVVMWVGAMFIMMGAFLVQVMITRASTGWNQTAILFVSACVELSLLMWWSSLFQIGS